MAVDAQALLQRVSDLQKAALGFDSVPFLFHVQGTYPFWTNRVDRISVDGDSEDFELYGYDIIMRLVIAHITEGVEGERESDLYSYIPAVIEYFNSRALLLDDTFTTELLGLVRASIVDCRGFAIFAQAGINTQLIGTEFTLRCQYEIEVMQVYD